MSVGKITLITSPDFFENRNHSILFVHLTEQEQDSVSKWLSDAKLESDLNLYVYNGETGVSWALWALNLCQDVYVNLDNANEITRALSGYLLSKSGVYYRLSDENLVSVYSHINNNRTSLIENFLESAVGGK
jgi:hypothetical protein